MFSTPEMLAAVSDETWLQAMLEVEAALASAQARLGVIPAEAATAIRAACDAGGFDIDAIGRAAVDSGTPVVPLVEALRALVPAGARDSVHYGATSQDILDTATMLVVRGGLDLVLADLDGVAAACAALAERHRATVMAGRTLLQQAVPITFGLKAAGWLVAAVEARQRLAELRATRLAVQFGGAAGTLAAAGPQGLEASRLMAAEVGLAAPQLPWHTNRVRVGEIGGGLAVAAGVMGKIALDVALLMQTEVGEVSEPRAQGRGRSSAMPQKRNPVGAVAVGAAVRRVHGLVAVLFGSMVQEHERAAGAWQAEWETLREVLALTGGAVHRVREMLEGLEVDAVRMRANLDAAGGMAAAEHVVVALAGRMGREEARAAVEAACSRALAGGQSLGEALLGDAAVRAHASAAEVEAWVDPAGNLGSSEALIERALAMYRSSAAR